MRNLVSKTLLIIDDNPAICTMLSKLFGQRGHRTLTAEDGLVGLQMARTEKPDLIVLDIMLPGMDGFKICRMIKFDQALRGIPVLVLTSRMGDEDRDLALKCGADAFLTKAVKIESIVKEAERLLAEKAEKE